MALEGKLPVVCTLDAEKRPGRESEAKQELAPRFIAGETHRGRCVLRFTADDQTLPALARFVSQEHQCCSFARYRIETGPPYEEVLLTILGPDGTGEQFRGLIEHLERAQRE